MEEKKLYNVGGQAVIEGVMMKGPEKLVTAVRRPNGEIVYRETTFKGNKSKLAKLPLIRGGLLLFSTMVQGSKELIFSADQAEETETKTSDKELFATVGLALLLGIGLFMVLPSLIGAFIFPLSKVNANLVEAAMRLIFFIAYVWLISFSKDIKRVFEYHGAEHKVIYTYENGYDLTAENAKKYTTLHPRCGTSFLLIVMLFSIITFALLDFILPTPETLVGKLGLKVFLRISLMPFIAGFSYEFQRFTSRHLDNKLVKAVAKPGLMLQNITTKEPDLEQLEVAVVALKVALGQEVDQARKITCAN